MWVFIHIPKTGGMSVRICLVPKRVLVGNQSGFPAKLVSYPVDTNKLLLPDQEGKYHGLRHVRWRDLHPSIKTLPAFSVVRNPWDRVVSMYEFLRATVAKTEKLPIGHVVKGRECVPERSPGMLHQGTSPQPIRDPTMHQSSLDNMRKMRQKHLGYLDSLPKKRLAKARQANASHADHPMVRESLEKVYVCDVGGIYNQDWKTYRTVFEDLPLRWHIADIAEHPTVTIKMYPLKDPFHIEAENHTFDLVVSGQTLEHCQNPFKLVTEMKRILMIGSKLVLIAPSTGPRHADRDGWRFMDDAFFFIAEDVGGLEIEEDYIDRSSEKWGDHVCVMRRVS